MSIDFNDIIKEGYVRLKSRKLGVWQKKWVILRKPSSKGPFRLEKYPDQKTSFINYQVTHDKYIDLSRVSSVHRLPENMKKCAFAVTMLDCTIRQLCVDSESEADAWVQVLQEQSQLHAAASRNNSFSSNPGSDVGAFPVVLKDRFNVYLVPSHALTFFGECIMQITSRDIILYDASYSRQRIMSWPLTSLRRYGKDGKKFTFESGRHCETGEGLFIFNTAEGTEINEQVRTATRAIAEASGLSWREQMNNNLLQSGRMLSCPIPGRSDVPSTLQHSLSDPGDLPANRAPCPLPREPVAIPERHLLPLPPVLGNGMAYFDHGGAASPHPSTDSAFSSDMEADPNEVIYEERGLAPDFRKYLAVRKDRGS